MKRKRPRFYPNRDTLMALAFLWKRWVCMFPITTREKTSLLLERESRVPCIGINNYCVETMSCIDPAYWRLVTWQFTPFALNRRNHNFPEKLQRVSASGIREAIRKASHRAFFFLSSPGLIPSCSQFTLTLLL